MQDENLEQSSASDTSDHIGQQDQVAQSVAADGQQQAAAESKQAGWGDDWRQAYAGEDAKLLKRLERFASPKALIDSYLNAEKKLSSGELKSALKEGATPEEITQWRKDNGIPDAPDAYDIKLDGGLVIGETDKPMIDDYLKQAHKANLTPAQVKENLQWYYATQEKALAAQANNDHAYRVAAEEALKGEWGADYQRNVNMIEGLLETAPQGVKERFLSGRMADGSLVRNDPNMLRWLANMAREIDPVATVAPGSGSNAMQAVETEIEQLTKMMGDTSSDYWKKGAVGEKHQARYRELVSARDKAQRR